MQTAEPGLKAGYLCVLEADTWHVVCIEVLRKFPQASSHEHSCNRGSCMLQVSEEVIICYGNGDGTFSAGLGVKSATAPETLFPWDFNGDDIM